MIKIIDKILPYAIIFWFMVVSFSCIITLVNFIPTTLEEYVFYIPTSLVLALINFIFILVVYFLTLCYLIKKNWFD